MIEGMCLTHRHDFGALPADQQGKTRTHMKQLYEHNIKPILESMETTKHKDGLVPETAFSTKTHLDLLEKLADTDATLVNMAFGVSEALGIDALKNSTDSFEMFLLTNDAMFIRNMSVEWRTYLIKLLLKIDDQYRDVATSRILLG